MPDGTEEKVTVTLDRRRAETIANAPSSVTPEQLYGFHEALGYLKQRLKNAMLPEVEALDSEPRSLPEVGVPRFTFGLLNDEKLPVEMADGEWVRWTDVARLTLLSPSAAEDVS